MRDKRIEFYIDTVWAIAASKYVAGYLIGYTASQLWRRFAAYRSLGYHHIVILEDKMTRKEALELEGIIQTAIKRDRRFLMYRKYHPEKRDNRHYPSAGQATSDPMEPIHSVYMAWWE